MLFLERQKSAGRALVNKNSLLRHSCQSFRLGCSDSTLSAWLGAFGHLGDVRLCTWALLGTSATFNFALLRSASANLHAYGAIYVKHK